MEETFRIHGEQVLELNVNEDLTQRLLDEGEREVTEMKKAMVNVETPRQRLPERILSVTRNSERQCLNFLVGRVFKDVRCRLHPLPVD